MTEEKKDEKERRKSIAWWLIVALLFILAICRFTCQKEAVVPLVPPEGEYFSQERQEQKQGHVGTSIPASVAVQDGKAVIGIINTGSYAYIPYTVAGGKEVYRASRALRPGERVTAVLSVGNAEKCVTYIQVPSGERFSVTTKLVH
ncbi:MAG: hypothetical protein ACOX2E_03360 [Syntrophaceticus sp.]